MAEKELQEFSSEEVFKHTSQDDCWLVIGNESNGRSVRARFSGLLAPYSNFVRLSAGAATVAMVRNVRPQLFGGAKR
jgi:hypothetical protein